MSLLDWLGLHATQQRYALEYAQVERILTLLADAGFKRGLDAEHLKRSLCDGDDDYRYSFKFALERLALSIAIPEHATFNQVLSYAKVQPGDFELIGTLIQIYQDLKMNAVTGSLCMSRKKSYGGILAANTLARYCRV